MNNFFIYLIQASICLAVLYSSYYVFFRKLTFHKINRILLLLLLPISLCLPFLNQVEIHIANQTLIIPDFDDIIPIEHPTQEVSLEPSEPSEKDWNPIHLLWFVYSIGMFIYLLRLLLSITQLYKLKKKSETFVKDGFCFIAADIQSIFSCFRWIFLPKDEINEIDPSILEHEKVHIKLGHTIDLIVTEIYLVVFWFNPFSYLFRKSIKSIHEYQADQSIINSQIKKSNYLELLAKNLGAKQSVKLYSYFNHSLIKKRIDMITKTNSNQKNLIRYILLIPVLAVLFMAFIKPKSNNNHIIEQALTEEIVIETPPSVFPIQNGSKDDITAAYGKNFNHPIRKKKVFHGGIDIRAKIGTPIIATANGTITLVKNEGDWGNLIVISHADGYETWYAHLESFNTKKNQQVQKGQIIGYSGNTGLSTGPHLHYEVKHNGKRVNPMDYF
ncbi:M23/M56 family metallopeptidase [uncultured Aquimarina sp.]|uniref:M23/M56 family metallopeptidase n=1 Tax=uncultured Aquimarina sp. TaxID=575652 RepID=UPI002618144D|nr:M23/M56 family metallopeptidase [uncultured Aquimarina sp.]